MAGPPALLGWAGRELKITRHVTRREWLEWQSGFSVCTWNSVPGIVYVYSYVCKYVCSTRFRCLRPQLVDRAMGIDSYVRLPEKASATEALIVGLHIFFLHTPQKATNLYIALLAETAGKTREGGGAAALQRTASRYGARAGYNICTS